MILDIIFFAFIIAFAVLGFVCGFFKTLVSFFGWFISILLAYLLAKSIANAILTENVAHWLVGKGSIFDKIYHLIPEGLKKISMNEVRDAMNDVNSLEAVRQSIRDQSEGIFKLFVSVIQEAVCKDMYLNSQIIDVGQVFALELTYDVYVIIVGVVLFIVLRVIVMGVSILFNSKFKNRAVKSWERFAGIGIGAVRGFAYACILLMVASYLGGVWGAVKNQVDNSKVSVPVTSWVSSATSRMLSGNLEDNEQYAKMIEVLGERIVAEEEITEE